MLNQTWQFITGQSGFHCLLNENEIYLIDDTSGFEWTNKGKKNFIISQTKATKDPESAQSEAGSLRQ